MDAAGQDSARWNRAAIAEGSAWLSEAVTRSGGAAGPYHELHTAVTLAPSQAEQRLLQDRLRAVRSELR